ncbi:maleylpyruvate isomerase family mycothiol-dependent enzyme [Streptomyces polyrhachis]|uniref:Maleylpyruvate isomerase family mycothiol-dependent enzyme n=1 Tax=Streptomyces polyrhachis TaxID=1282885 RepID=A0ABW2GBC6_9ACTN
MPDARHDLQLLHEATERLLAAAGKLDDGAVAAPSLLPGWTRGHVLSHLARNADALVNVLTGLPMYASAETRDADIEAGAGRGLAEQLADVRASAERLAATADALSPADWESRCELRNGVTDVRARIPFRRLQEVELHHVDLGIGYGPAALPAEFTGREVDFLAERFAGNGAVPALSLTDAAGRTWTTGSAAGEPLAVAGEAAALMGWLSGRTDGSDLSVAGGGALPVLPPL